MSLKLKALIQTAGLLALAVVIAATVNFIIANVSTETVIKALGAGFIAWFVYIFYSIRLASLEYNEKLREMTEKKG